MSSRLRSIASLGAPGVFTSASTLPHVGGLAAVRIKLHFTATTADGTSISLDVPVSYR